MRRIIFIVATSGWAGIVALAWWLAGRRIELCSYLDNDCELRATADRDYVLIAGLSIGLCLALLALLVTARLNRRVRVDTHSARITRWERSRRADRHLLP
ncbi:MAG TPA: hypothetical protein VFH89_00290 [Sphingomicrobium sp.]|nr:hypothetical protein [Sphingomicrobium sp.]